MSGRVPSTKISEYKKEIYPLMNTTSPQQDNFDSLKKNFLTTSDKLSSNLSANPSPGILLVYSDGCGHCIHFKPEYVKLYHLIQQWNNAQNKVDPKQQNGKLLYKNFHIFALDGANRENAPFMATYNVRGVPSLFIISQSGEIFPYEPTKRDAETIWKDLLNYKTPKILYQKRF